MRVLKLIFSLLAVLFAVMGLTNVLPYTITNPIMMLCLSGTFFMNAVEYYNMGNLKSAKYYALLGVVIVFIIFCSSFFVTENI